MNSDDIPLWFWWEDLRGGPLAACDVPGFPPMPVAIVLPGLPCPWSPQTVGRIFQEAFRKGLAAALRRDERDARAAAAAAQADRGA